MTGSYSVEYRRRALRYLARLGRKDRERIEDAINRLAIDPKGRGLDVKKLEIRPVSRLRIGPFRIIFELERDTATIHIVAIGPRGNVYKG